MQNSLSTHRQPELPQSPPSSNYDIKLELGYMYAQGGAPSPCSRAQCRCGCGTGEPSPGAAEVGHLAFSPGRSLLSQYSPRRSREEYGRASLSSIPRAPIDPRGNPDPADPHTTRRRSISVARLCVPHWHDIYAACNDPAKTPRQARVRTLRRAQASCRSPAPRAPLRRQ